MVFALAILRQKETLGPDRHASSVIRSGINYELAGLTILHPFDVPADQPNQAYCRAAA